MSADAARVFGFKLRPLTRYAECPVASNFSVTLDAMSLLISDRLLFLKIMQNHFELFELPVSFDLDLVRLDSAYHTVQQRVHPDKFSAGSAIEKRVAMQWATRANQAYETLKHPLKRAAYLCELQNIDVRNDAHTAMPAAFLVQQMEWRESLEEAQASKDVSTLEALEKQLHESRQSETIQIADFLREHDYANAALSIRKLMFIEKFGDEIVDGFDLLS
jgi:molecular chaperone HscB